MANTLSSAITPRAWDHPHSYTIPVTEPVPEGAYIRIGDDQRGENLDVFECSGTGPYLLRLAKNFTGTHMAGTPVTVLKTAEEQDAAILARVREVLTRTGTTEGAFVALLGITADKARASLAGDRRFSTYELAVIAKHGGTTVEWLCGDDEPEPNARIQAAVAQMRAERTATPERDGYTIAVYLPPGVSTSVQDYLFQAIGDLAHTADWHQDWDAHVVGVAGDPMGAVDGQVRP